MKTCTYCKTAKPLDSFGKDNRGFLGLQARCRACAVECNRLSRIKNPESTKASRAADYAAHSDAYKARAKARYEARRDEIKLRTAEYQNANKDKKSLWNSKYSAENKHLSRIKTANRKAQRLNATPAWANHAAIKELYLKAQKMTTDSGVAYHVDHIVPLQSTLVCGLHCEANMEVITGSENSAKRNWYWPDMPTDEKE